MACTEHKKETIVSNLKKTMPKTSKAIFRLLFAQADNKDSKFTTDDIIEVLREVCATQNKSKKESNNMGHDR